MVYILSRSACVWLADHPEHYHGVTGGGVTSDVTLYRYWAERIVRDRDVPYADVAVEYPPGSLPFIVAPEIVSVSSYRSALIATMLLIDGLGLLGVVRVARRWGSALGPWLWVLLIPLIGPISFVRLDLVPAVATIWMVERASAKRWGGAGAWLGAGTAAKLYPVLFLPMVTLVSPIRRRTVMWAVLVMGLAFLPFAGSPRGVFSSIFAYHAGRDIQIESTWGLVLLVASRLGGSGSIGFDAGSFNVTGPMATTMQGLALLLSLVVLAIGTLSVQRYVPREDASSLTGLMFAVLALLLSISTILSPQFIIWLAAMGAAAGCVRNSPIGVPLLLLLPIAGLTQLIYPFEYHHVLGADTSALVVLGVRNGLLIVVGALSVARLRHRFRSSPVDPKPIAE